MYTIEIKTMTRPHHCVRVMYDQPLNRPLAPFKVVEMYHQVHDDHGAVTMTNMCHMIPDVMNGCYFTPLRVQIEHEIEVARRNRNIFEKGEDV